MTVNKDGIEEGVQLADDEIDHRLVTQGNGSVSYRKSRDVSSDDYEMTDLTNDPDY